jgi:hypothetical protein
VLAAQASRSYRKQLRTELEQGARPELIFCRDESAQAVEVCERVLQAREQGMELRSQAVLMRASHDSDLLELELTRRQIPFVKYGGLRYLEAAHVKDLIALFRLVDNPANELSWFRVLQLLEGVGPVTARRVLDSLIAGQAGGADGLAGWDRMSLTSGMSILATGAWYMLRGQDRPEARVMLHWCLGLVAVIIPLQLVFGHFTGIYVLNYQPAKFAAIEARWTTQKPASEVLIAIPDPSEQRNLLALQIPKLGSFIASGTWDAGEGGLDAFPPEDRPPVIIPFFEFCIVVGIGLIMLAISWLGNLFWSCGHLE